MSARGRDAPHADQSNLCRLSAELSHDKRAELIGMLNTWNFRPHKLSDPDVFRCACLLFEAVLLIDGLQQLDIQRDQLHRWLFAIRAIYHAPNPYHNYVHAIDVLQASYTFLREIGVLPPLDILLSEDRSQPWRRPAKIASEERTEEDNARLEVDKILRPQDVFAVMIAAIGHDVGHPGLSNVFMVRRVCLTCCLVGLTRRFAEKRQNSSVAGLRRPVRP